MNTTQLKNEQMTFDKLAVMINNGFKETHKDLIDAISGLRQELSQEFKKEISELQREMIYRFDGIQNQLDNIYLNYTQRREFTLLQVRVKKIERKVGITTV